MKKLSLFVLATILMGVVAGCSGGSVSESSALDKASEIEQQTKAAGGEPQKQ